MLIDKQYYEWERELINKYGLVSKAPEDDSTLIKIRDRYGGQQMIVRDTSMFDHIKLYEPKHKISILDTDKIKRLLNDKNLQLKDFDETFDKHKSFISKYLTAGHCEKESVKQLAGWLDVDYESIVIDEEAPNKQPNVDFDATKVNKHIAENAYIIEHLSHYLGLIPSRLQVILHKQRAPVHIIKSLYDMVGEKWQD